MRASKRDEQRGRRASLSNEMKSIRAFRDAVGNSENVLWSV